jgi:hypothetical protein
MTNPGGPGQSQFDEARSVKIDPNGKVLSAKGDGKRYIVQSDELLTAFLELEATLL